MLIVTQECANQPVLHAVGEAKEGLVVLFTEYGPDKLVSALGDILVTLLGSEYTAARLREEVANAEERAEEPDQYEPQKQKKNKPQFCAPWTGANLRITT